MRNRGAAIGRALGAIPPVYDTHVKNMRAAQAATIGLEQLKGEELQERLRCMNKLLGTANTQQDRLDHPTGSVSRHTKDPKQPNTASSPPPAKPIPAEPEPDATAL